MRARPLYVKLFVAIVALLTTVPWAYAQDGLQGALSRANVVSPANLATPFRQTLAAADFDGDHKPDGAVLLDDGWLQSHGVLRKIEIHLSGRRNTELTFESSEAELAISALDINHDGATDIVVERPLSRKRLHVWLNDGRGGFHEAAAQDFQSVVEVSGRQLESPTERQGCLAACLPPQRGFDGTAFGARALSLRDSSPNAEAQVYQSTAASRVTAASSSRAPPLPESL